MTVILVDALKLLMSAVIFLFEMFANQLFVLFLFIGSSKAPNFRSFCICGKVFFSSSVSMVLTKISGMFSVEMISGLGECRHLFRRNFNTPSGRLKTVLYNWTVSGKKMKFWFKRYVTWIIFRQERYLLTFFRNDVVTSS